MKVDANLYTKAFPALEALNDKYKNDPAGRLIGMFASATHVPCIVVALYLQEKRKIDLSKTIDNLKKFYKYTEVVDFYDKTTI